MLYPGLTITKISYTKGDVRDDGIVRLIEEVTFSNGETMDHEVQSSWDWVHSCYVYHPLADDQVPRGIYSYVDGKFLVVEDWDEGTLEGTLL